MGQPVAPHAGAWIETGLSEEDSLAVLVAPHAGAWIETLNHPLNYWRICVAPHAGAWIETAIQYQKPQSSLLHPMRVRGLKHLLGLLLVASRRWSHPMRVRGLKLRCLPCFYKPQWSHPMRVRGLKRDSAAELALLSFVAPMRVRIETWHAISVGQIRSVAPPCGCVD